MASCAPSAPSYGSFPETPPQPSLSAPTTSSYEDSPDDPTIIPDTQVVHPPKRAPTAPPSTVETNVGEDGVYSHDPTLDYDAEELWRYLTSNLAPPRVEIRLLGSHTETRTRVVTTTTKSRVEKYTETITDCDFHVDVTKYVLPHWSRIVAHPSGRGRSSTATVRATLEEYTSSRNAFKEFHLEKHVMWDYDRVKQLLTDLLRSSTAHGRRHVKISVAFPKRDWKVSAFASNRYSRAAHSTLVRVLCIMSWLWIIFLPAWAIARKRMKNRLTCEYAMAVNADEFYGRNWFQIHSAILRRCQGQHLVAL